MRYPSLHHFWLSYDKKTVQSIKLASLLEVPCRLRRRGLVLNVLNNSGHGYPVFFLIEPVTATYT